MPKFLPVPWHRWRRYRVEGVVREQESGRPISGLVVNAFDKDLVKDDYLGQAETDAEGRFEIRFLDSDFKDVAESNPDIYLSIFVHGHDEPIHDTSYAIRWNASHEEYYEIEIPRASLPSLAS